MKRRTLLQAAGLAALVYPLRSFYSLQTSPQFSTDPFSASVASGDPTQNSVVLWTRLIPDSNVERDWQRGAVSVDWQVASDQAMKNIVRNGSAQATPDLGHSVHVDVTGLDPN